MATKRKSTAAPHAVYRGQDVKLFAQDLSNYAQLRRGLSPAMRQQTLTKEQLRKVSPDTVISYINALNEWRQSPQREKIIRGQATEISTLEGIFLQGLQSDYYSPEQKAVMAAANLKMKSMPQQQARMEIRENLNAIDRARGGDWYTPTDYWATKFYMEHGEWDPTLASNNMLRVALTYGFMDDYPRYKGVTLDEYAARNGADVEAMVASEVASYRQDILAVAKLFVKGS